MSTRNGDHPRTALTRHDPISHTDPATGRTSWYQRDELLVAEEDLPHVREQARRYIDWHAPLAGAGVVRLRLRRGARVSVPELASQLADSHPRRRIAVTANHVLRGESGYPGGPPNRPAPAAPLERPPARLGVTTNETDPAWPGGASGPPTAASTALTPRPSGGGHSPMLMQPCPQWPGGGEDSPLPQPAEDMSPPDPWRPSAQRGGQVRVAILDTGISPHPWWNDAPWFADCGPGQHEVLDPDGAGTLAHEAGHGTFIAGLILQRAPEAYLLVERILRSDGYCDESLLIAGLARLAQRTIAIGAPVHVINLSLGGYAVDDEPSPLLSRALGAFGRGTVTVACAGNNDSDREFWPGSLKRVVAVGALEPDRSSRSSFSNYGWWVDACTVGERLTSTFVDFTEADGTRYEGFATWNGTSFAAPQVAGAIAALAAEQDLRPSAALDVLLDQTTHPSVPDLGVIVPPAETALCAAGVGSDAAVAR